MLTAFFPIKFSFYQLFSNAISMQNNFSTISWHVSCWFFRFYWITFGCARIRTDQLFGLILHKLQQNWLLLSDSFVWCFVVECFSFTFVRFTLTKSFVWDCEDFVWHFVNGPRNFSSFRFERGWNYFRVFDKIAYLIESFSTKILKTFYAVHTPRCVLCCTHLSMIEYWIRRLYDCRLIQLYAPNDFALSLTPTTWPALTRSSNSYTHTHRHTNTHTVSLHLSRQPFSHSLHQRASRAKENNTYRKRTRTFKLPTERERDRAHCVWKENKRKSDVMVVEHRNSCMCLSS